MIKSIIKINLLLLIFGCKLVYSQTFTEILGRPTNTTITISILFDQKEDVYWEYGTTSGTYNLSTTPMVAPVDTPLEADFTNLLPDTKYYYRTRYRAFGSSTSYQAGIEHTFHTQRAQGSTFTFDVEADEHLYDYGDANLYNITLKNEALDNPDFLITLGDIFGDDHYPWTITSNTCDSLHRLYRAHLGTICHSIPFYICLGNHEGEKEYYLDSMPPNNLAVWSTLWRKFYYPNPYPNNFYSGDTVHEGYGIGQPENYYAWTWGNALFVVLDVYRYDCYYADTTAKPGDWEWTLGYTEYSWLKNTLENSTAQFKFVFAHHVSGESRGGIVPAKLCEWGGYNKNGIYAFTSKRPGWAKPIHQLFVDNGVNIFFQGHDHLFAHEVLDSVTYQEVPMAADSTYIKGMVANGAAYMTDTIDASGHVRVTVSPSCVQVDYVRAFLPADTVSGVHHNREVAFSYTLGNCATAVEKRTKTDEYVKVFPNPAKDNLTVAFSKDTKTFQISLINALGQTLLQSQSNIVDVSHIQNGIYFLNIRTENYEENRKVVISR